ncbi:MAG: formylmethanofuran--tetrahydromethanopterin formyltransferase, partial [Candidatus Bathyarchaeia archaeon]
MSVLIEDTYAEAFDGLYFRILVTASDKRVLIKAAEDATATPSTVIGRIEGGIESWVPREKTPDGRLGVILQFWSSIDERKPIEESVRKFYRELSYRIRQDI